MTAKQKDQVRQQIKRLVAMLATKIPQSAKIDITVVIENLLYTLDEYRGYNNLYWTKNGYTEWYASQANNKNQDKKPFIIGPNAAKLDGKMIYNTKAEKWGYSEEYSNFTSDIEGEYARNYYGKF